uniref:Uncharacterized protein n=1 Tax=Cacopsylla melanoneura TaxID=428564 RepID=A0A8D8Z7K7_9HEMI
MRCMSIAVSQGPLQLLLVLNHRQHLQVTLLSEPEPPGAHHIGAGRASSWRRLFTFGPTIGAGLGRVTETHKQLADENGELLNSVWRPKKELGKSLTDRDVFQCRCLR